MKIFAFILSYERACVSEWVCVCAGDSYGSMGSVNDSSIRSAAAVDFVLTLILEDFLFVASTRFGCPSDTSWFLSQMLIKYRLQNGCILIEWWHPRPGKLSNIEPCVCDLAASGRTMVATPDDGYWLDIYRATGWCQPSGLNESQWLYSRSVQLAR